MSDNIKNAYGLKIGGSVGPNDSVGVHVAMPTQPGVGLSIDINDQLDSAIRQISEKVSNDDPKASDVRNMITAILAERNQQTKIGRVKAFIEFGANITSIAANVLELRRYLPI